MPISTTLNKKQYNCDGAQTDFAFPYKCFAAADMLVVITDSLGAETTLVLNTHYTVAPTNNDYKNGCVVTTIGADSPYASGNKITLIRDLTLDQSADFEPYGNLPSNTIDNCLDKLMMVNQQLKEAIGRQLLLKISSGYSDLTIPDPEADKYLAWKADLSGLKNLEMLVGTSGVTTFIKTLLDDENAAEALTTLGISAFIQTLLDDVDAAAARTTLDAIGNPLLTTLGDLIIRGAANPERLAAGVLDSYLKGQGAGVKPIYEKLALRDTGVKIGQDTRSGTGDQIITGVGFQPSTVIFLSCIPGGFVDVWSVGYDNNGEKISISSIYTGAIYLSNLYSLYANKAAGNFLQGYISAVSSDGFTLTWVLSGAAFTMDFCYLCLP